MKEICSVRLFDVRRWDSVMYHCQSGLPWSFNSPARMMMNVVIFLVRQNLLPLFFFVLDSLASCDVVSRTSDVPTTASSQEFLPSISAGTRLPWFLSWCLALFLFLLVWHDWQDNDWLKLSFESLSILHVWCSSRNKKVSWQKRESERECDKRHREHDGNRTVQNSQDRERQFISRTAVTAKRWLQRRERLKSRNEKDCLPKTPEQSRLED
jgi:hypothetical protein